LFLVHCIVYCFNLSTRNQCLQYYIQISTPLKPYLPPSFNQPELLQKEFNSKSQRWSYKLNS
jgi:hypothetical protein